MSGILTYALHYEGEFNKNSLGAVSEGAKLAKEIGGDAAVVVVGGDDLTDDLCASLGKYGATKVYRAKGDEGLGAPVVDAMAKVITDEGYSYALFGGGLLGFEIGAGLTARLNAGVTMEVTAVKAQDGKLVAERPILQDSAIVDVEYVGEPGIIIGRLNAFDAVEGDGTAEVVDVDVSYEEHSTKATMVQRGEQRGADVNIEDADLLVAGGRGLGKAEGFELCEELAERARRRRGGHPRGGRRRLVPLRRADRPDGQDGRAEAVPGGRHLRGHPAQGRACRAPRTSWRSTRTRTPRSSSSPTSASSAT